MIATDYRGIIIVRCSNCGETYPCDYHGCPECGSMLMEMIKENERSETN